MSMSDFVKKNMPKLVTWSLVAVAAFGAYLLYSRWTSNPWTRDGQVRADIVKIAPQVGGNLVKVAVTDNQVVRQGGTTSPFRTRREHIHVDSDETSCFIRS